MEERTRTDALPRGEALEVREAREAQDISWTEEPRPLVITSGEEDDVNHPAIPAQRPEQESISHEL